MSDLFKGLESLGFGDVSHIENTEIFKKEEQKKRIPEKKEAVPSDFIYERKFTCPCCDKGFINYAIRQSRVRFLRADTDLRNYYEPYDPLYYDAILCPHCGYSALNAFFRLLTDKQIDLIQANITSRFKPKEYPMVYSASDAAERSTYALLNAVVKNVKNSEKANICLKLSWLYRDMKNNDKELAFTKRALEGFTIAIEKEVPPICGMDVDTATYLIAELHRRAGDYTQAMKWVSHVVTSKAASKNIKEKAIDLRTALNKRKGT